MVSVFFQSTKEKCLTFVVVDKDILVARAVLVVITVPYGDGEGVGSTDHGFAAVAHNDGHVVVLFILAVKRALGGDDTGSLAIHSPSCKDDIGFSLHWYNLDFGIMLTTPAYVLVLRVILLCL